MSTCADFSISSETRFALTNVSLILIKTKCVRTASMRAAALAVFGKIANMNAIADQTLIALTDERTCVIQTGRLVVAQSTPNTFVDV